MTNNNPFNELQPRLTAWTEGVSESATRTQQALVNFLLSASQAQFGFSRGLTEDFAQTFTGNASPNPAMAMQGLLKCWHQRSEQAIAEFRRIGDDLRNSMYESVEQRLETGSAAGPAAGARER